MLSLRVWPNCSGYQGRGHQRAVHVHRRRCRRPRAVLPPGWFVVLCKSWRWSALDYAAATVAALASNNSLGSLSSALVIPIDGEDSDSMTSVPPPHFGFHQVCDSIYLRSWQSCNDMLTTLRSRSVLISASGPDSQKASAINFNC